MKLKNYANLCICISLCLIFWGLPKAPDTIKTNSAPGNIKLVILMYHGFTNKETETEYVINAKRLDEDIEFLKNQGFEFIDTNDLIAFINGKKRISQKAVMLTFDDGNLNNYTYAFPILKNHSVKAVISPIGYYVEYYTQNSETNPRYTQLRSREIKEMHQSGLIDFQNHSYNMHSLEKRKGSSKLDFEKSEEYIREFYYDLKKAENVIKEITGKKTHAYVYPFGNISEESEYILKCLGYKITLSCTEGFNTVYPDGKSLYKLKRFNRTPQKSAADILAKY